MASTYNPYSDIQKVYNAKVAWNNATTDEERKRQNEIANSARKTLEAYGYSDVANQISAYGADATAARKIMEQYAPKTTTTTTKDTTPKATTAPDSTTLSNTELITTNNNETRNKINQLWGNQTSDREMMTEKYNKLEDTAYSNPFETDEAKAILAKYDLSGLQARDNATASGGGSNGGNIDSYASANALRQQSALINQGHTAVLDAHNNRIANVQNTLSNLGVYLQNQDKGMQNTITLQSNEGQRLFENEETAKNNDVARKSEMASVTGVAPDEWVVSNNPYMNDDGTIKDEYKNIDFSAVMAKAKAAGNTEAYNAAATARYYKIMGDYGAYGKYDDGNYLVPGEKKTEAARQFDVNTDVALKTLGVESDTTKYVADAEKSAKLTENILKASEPTLTASQAVTALKNGEKSQAVIDAYNYYYGTNYTVDNPPVIKTSEKQGNAPLTEEEVTEWVNYLNNDINNKYGEEYKALKETGKNKYERADADADYIIISVLQSADLTDEQKKYLLIDKFGITQDQINATINDPHYR